MQRRKSKKFMKWILTFVSCVTLFGMSAFAMNLEEGTMQETIGPAFEACLLDEEGYTLLRSGQPFNSEDTLWVSADTIGELYVQLSESENLATHPYIAITTTSTEQSESEGIVVIPDVLGESEIRGVAICAWNENEPLKVDGFEANTSLYVTGNIEGDVEIIYPQNEESSGVEVVLEDTTVSGKVYTDKNIEQGTNSLLIFDGVKVGGLEGFETVYLWGNMTTTGKVEFNTVNTSACTRTLLIEGYAQENIPVFNELITSEDRAYAYKTALTDKTLYPVYEIAKEDGNFGYYVKSEENYYEVQPYSEVAVYGELSDFTIVNDEALMEELNAVTDVTEKYMVYEYELYQYEDESGKYEYIYKENEGAYRITSNGDIEGKEEDIELAAQVEAAVALEYAGDLNTVAESYNHNGGRVEAPNILISYVEPLEENVYIHEYTPIAYGTQVVCYNTDISNLVEMQKDYSYYSENTEGDEDIVKGTDDIIVGLDGKVYSENKAFYELGVLTENGYNYGGVIDDEITNIKVYPNWENVVLAMQSEASDYYYLAINNKYDSSVALEKITLPQEVKGLTLEVCRKAEENQNYVLFEELNIPNENQGIAIRNTCAGGESENNEDTPVMNVTGNGQLIFISSKINQNIVVADTVNVKFVNENSIKSLTGGKIINFDSSAYVAVEDFLDASKSQVTGEVKLAARYDAELLFGSIDGVREDLLGLDKNGEELFEKHSFEITSERKNGQNTKIRFTSNDINFGYDAPWYYEETRNQKYIIYNSINENGEQAEYICIDGQWYMFDADNELKEASCPDNLGDGTVMGEIKIYMLDADKESVFSANSLYGAKSCFYTYNEPDATEYDYSKDYNNSLNYVEYTTEDEIEAAVIDEEVLPSDTKEREAYFAYFRNIYGNSDNREEIVYENMAAYETASLDIEDSIGMYGLPVLVDKGNEMRYVMFRWRGVGPIVDTNKYITVYKKAGVHVHTSSNWIVEKEATETEEG